MDLSESELNVNALCELSGISNKQIYRKIKQLTVMSPVEYIKSIRMKKAAMLLQQKKFTVAEVMYREFIGNAFRTAQVRTDDDATAVELFRHIFGHLIIVFRLKNNIHKRLIISIRLLMYIE